MARQSGIKLLILSKYLVAVILVIALHCPSSAQTVSTYISGSGLNGPDGFALDRHGALYVANWGHGAGSTVLKITAAGEVSTHLSGLSAPDGLIFDQSGNLYVSNFASGIINKVTPDGKITVFA
ncbi:MAG: hypothetical protein GY869_02185, partial [Planctomycetes bacterium]|nr:hypothetical protein [Planctomycetota bacterium]